MKITPAGRRSWIAIHHIPKLCVFLAWLLTFMPKSLLEKIISFWMKLTSSASTLSEASLRGIVNLLNPTSVEQMLYLAHTELEIVLEPDYDQVRRHNPILRFYYGTIDDWVPVQFYEEMKKNVPNVNAELCQLRIPHAFVLSSSEKVAGIVATWMSEK